MCESLARFFLFGFNFVFVLTGIALIGMGAYIQIEMTQYIDFIGDQYLNTGVVLIIVGVVIFGIAFLGCCGAMKHNACMLLTFATLLSIIFIAEVALVIVCYVFKDDAKPYIKENMQKTLENYGKEGNEGVAEVWDILQSEYKCCGIEGKDDWTGKGTPEFASGQTPDSCCDLAEVEEGCGKEAAKQKYEQGCLVKFVDDIKGNVPIVAGVGVGIALIQIIGVITACVIGKKVKDGLEYV
jgi:hypothetical protein